MTGVLRRWVGIDPGCHGAISVLEDTGRFDICKLFEKTDTDIRDFLVREVLDREGEAFAMLEFVRSSPLMGVVSAFTFGRSYGLLRGLLVGLGIPHSEVPPAKWQKRLGCLTHGDKNVSKAKAQELFPCLKWTHDTADSALIAAYARWATISGVPV